jgi:hypothetical protein
VPVPADSASVRRADAIDLLSWLAAASLIALVEWGHPSPARVVLAFGFAFFVPGRAIVSNWPEVARWSALAMPMVLSLAVLVLLATVTLWAHAWYPLGLLQAEAWVSLAGLAIGIARRHRRAPGPAAQPPSRPDEHRERDDDRQRARGLGRTARSR